MSEPLKAADIARLRRMKLAKEIGVSRSSTYGMVHPDHEHGVSEDERDIEALAKAIAYFSAQVESGSGHIGAAEREVGEAVYLRIDALMDAKPGTPDGAELSYLADLVQNVEEYGSYDGPPPVASHPQETT